MRKLFAPCQLRHVGLDSRNVCVDRRRVDYLTIEKAATNATAVERLVPDVSLNLATPLGV
jgi:hypothetical protein